MPQKSSLWWETLAHSEQSGCVWRAGTGWVSFKLHHCHLTDTGHGSDNDRDIWKGNTPIVILFTCPSDLWKLPLFLNFCRGYSAPNSPHHLPFYNLFSSPRLESSIGQELCSVYLRTLFYLCLFLQHGLAPVLFNNPNLLEEHNGKPSGWLRSVVLSRELAPACKKYWGVAGQGSYPERKFWKI